MSKIIQDLWIINSGGIALYNSRSDIDINEQVFGSVLTAINCFAKGVVNNELSSFIVGSKKFTILKSKNLLFVGSSSKGIKEKIIHNKLKKISSKFLEKYSPLLRNWDHKMKVFSDFENDVRALLDRNQVKEFLKIT
jgi:hypothetical protein